MDQRLSIGTVKLLTGYLLYLAKLDRLRWLPQSRDEVIYEFLDTQCAFGDKQDAVTLVSGPDFLLDLDSVDSPEQVLMKALEFDLPDAKVDRRVLHTWPVDLLIAISEGHR